MSIVPLSAAVSVADASAPESPLKRVGPLNATSPNTNVPVSCPTTLVQMEVRVGAVRALLPGDRAVAAGANAHPVARLAATKVRADVISYGIRSATGRGSPEPLTNSRSVSEYKVERGIPGCVPPRFTASRIEHPPPSFPPRRVGGMAVSGRHVSAGHHRGDDGDAHGVGGERADGDLHPYVAGEGTRLFDDVPKAYRLDLVSSTEFSNGSVGLHYRRHR